MAKLHYRDPGTGNWIPLSTAGPPGPAPAGGVAGQVVTKQSAAEGDIGWGTVDAVWIGTDPPTDPAIELWWDTDATPTAGGRAGGTKVFVQSTTPSGALNGDLWIDPTKKQFPTYADLLK